MARGAAVGVSGAALTFGLIAVRDAEIAIEATQGTARTVDVAKPSHLCNAEIAIAVWPD